MTGLVAIVVVGAYMGKLDYILMNIPHCLFDCEPFNFDPLGYSTVVLVLYCSRICLYVGQPEVKH
ncbi:hypothetical protein RchiOBHm_Chr4g0436341 [Rosa chinensis]|uniref:Uncharacterized protein n=1 Tax=Rosa chinensis TaxID=74649 RepID=A0A2P6R215_ROSCH|nr:hypothetical protein RchiOBHm_Chr4g0436341 [Rosa chinensis]